jgi:hypothetical protein
MLDNRSRRDLERLAREAQVLLEHNSPAPEGLAWQERIDEIWFDSLIFHYVLGHYTKQGASSREKLAILRNLTDHGFDPRKTALDFVRRFFAEIRDIICNPKRRTKAARLSRGSLGPTCAGLAAFIMQKFGLSEPIATAVATYLLIVVLEVPFAR